MLLALTHTLVSEGLHDREFLDEFCAGFERVLPYLMGESDGQPKDADWAAPITGVPADTIRALARRMAATRTMVTASWSLQRAHHGEQPYWAVVLLASALGQIGLPGGGFGFGYGSGAGIGDPPLSFAAPAMDGIKQPDQRHDPGGAHLRLPAAPGRAVRLQRQARHLSRHPAGLLGRRQSVPSSPGHQQAARAPGSGPRPSWCTSRGGPRPRATPTSCCRRPRRSSATTSAARARDKFIIAMQQAIEPVGEARNDFAIFSELAQRLGLPSAYTQGRDEKAWLRHLYEQLPPQRRRQRRGAAGLRHVLADRLSGNPARAARNTCCSATSAPIRTSTSCARRPAGSSSTPRRSRASATTTARRIRPGSSRGNGSAARTPRPIRCISSRASRATGCTARWTAARSAPAARSRAARRSCINPADAKARGIRDGDVVRVHNARGACLAGAIVSDTVSAGVVKLVLRRLVRSGRRRRAGALPARQCQCADARPGHLEARAGAELGDRAGRGRALHRSRSQPVARVRSAAGVAVTGWLKARSLPAGRHHADRRRGPARAEAAAVAAAAIKSRPAPAVWTLP